MKNKELIAILEEMDPDLELSVKVQDIVTGETVAETFDVGFALR